MALEFGVAGENVTRAYSAARSCPASLGALGCSLGLTPTQGFGTMLLSENLQAAHSRKGLAGSCGSTHWTMSRIFQGYTLKWNTEPSLVVSPRRSETILRHPGCAGVSKGVI